MPTIPTDSLALPSRVVAYSGGGLSAPAERLVAAPGPGEFRLRLASCGLCGTDLFKLAQDGVPPGTVLGHEVVGTIESVGPGVEAFRAGDRVVVPHHVACGRCALCRRGSETLCPVFRENLFEPGGFSEFVLVRARAASLAARTIPDGIRDEAAIFMEPAACVLRGVWRSGLPALEGSAEEWGRPTVVILGAGSMGLLHLLVLRSVSPEFRIIVTDKRPDRLLLATKLGAHGATEPGPALAALVRDSSEGLGADAVFDTVGGAALLDAALELSREGGTVVLFAHAGGGERARFDINRLFKNERRVIGTYSGGLREQAEVFRLIASGRLDASPLVTHRLPFSRFEEAVRLSRSLDALKVLLDPKETP